jgi:hypothetical protein
MSELQRTGAHGRTRADVRQALLKPMFAHLYPGIPHSEWQPAAVLAELVLTVNSHPRPKTNGRSRALDERHFEFRGLPSAGTRDDQRRTRLEDRQRRRTQA